MTGFKKIYGVFERKPAFEFDPGWTPVSHQALTSKPESEVRAAHSERNDLVHLFQPLGIEAEFLGHLDQLL